ncbi:hypothetical protein [Alloyangia pacifica]|uniref:hypothetical protein n=1 Tax=Alloyangia pacifica TaxID=311180 RepID=UPI001CFE6410|nr:hypothetical protein [Alloyangia pacifica]
MTPDFALSLSSDGLTLLRREAGGWLALADGDLSADGFDAMRERAQALGPTGTQVALFLPNDQVRYVELPDPGTDDGRRAALEAALDGATPYPVAELVLDWSLSGTTLLGAAVARESLEEAEGFLRDRGFSPVYFAAIPPSGTFRGTAYFGPAGSWQGPAPERPGKVVLLPLDEAEEPEVRAAVARADTQSVSDPEEPSAPDAEAAPRVESDPETAQAAVPVEPPVAEAAPAAVATPAPEAPDAQTPAEAARAASDSAPAETPVRAEARQRQASLAFDTPPPAPAPEADAAPEPAHAPFPEAPPPVPAPAALSAPTAQPAAPSFTSVRASRSPAPAAPAAAPRLSMGRETPAATRPAPAPTPDPAAPAPAAPVDAPLPGPAAVSEGTPGAQSPSQSQAPSQAQAQAQSGKRRPFGFGKRREKIEPAAPIAPPTPPRTPEEPETGSGTTQGIKQVTPRPPVSHPLDPSGSAPVSGQARVAALRRESGNADSRARRAAASLTPEEERERLTVFGARGGQKVGGKPRFLGLILTVLLLLFLAAVAAFSSVFLGEEISRLFSPAEEDTAALSATEEITAPIPAAAVLPEAEADPEEDADSVLAALELPPAESEGFEEVPAPQVSARNLMTSDEAASTYAVTGIWQRAPTPPDRPPQTNAEDVYVASIDPEVQQFDAVALPDLDAGPRDDLSLEPVRLPPGPGVRFDLDDRGLVSASPEGTVSPDGVRIFSGLPPQTPPLRDPAPEAAPETPADPAAATEGESADGAAPEQTEETAADPALADFRPRGRPGDLIEQTERAVLGGVSLAELEQMRPEMRPLTAQEEAAALDLPVTDQAIGASLTPLPRPRSMEAIVAEAAKQASNAPAIAPGPSIPQNANVAKNATLSDQIDLRDVSLIGIYGKDSDRRALIRLPSGKYQKVQVGDRIDGGRIAAIDDDELRYVKGGRNVVLKMPRS